MKKLVFMALTSLMVLATSCKKEENKETPTETTSIEGTWYLQKMIEGDKIYEADDCRKKNSIMFSAGKMEQKFYGSSRHNPNECVCECKDYDLSKSYTIEGNKITIKSSRDTEEITFSIKDNTLTITYELGGKEIYVKR